MQDGVELARCQAVIKPVEIAKHASSSSGQGLTPLNFQLSRPWVCATAPYSALQRTTLPQPATTEAHRSNLPGARSRTLNSAHTTLFRPEEDSSLRVALYF